MTTRFIQLFIAATLALFQTIAPAQDGKTSWSKDPTKIVGSETCIECHQSSHTVWEGTSHHGTYTEMPENPKALEIAEKMGVDALDLSTSETCMQCHFTVQKEDDKLKAISGISCESCHGAAADWLEMHSDEKKPREARFAEAAKLGMNRPGNLYSLFSNCMECHTAPNEKLINTGGHSLGSAFELVSWSQGEIRHTFNKEETSNEVASPEKLRVLFVLGKALEAQYSLKAISGVTEAGGAYQQGMVARYQQSVQFLQAIQQAIPGHAEIGAIVAAAQNVGGGDAASLKGASDAVAAAAKAFSEKSKGTELAGIDQYVQQWLGQKKGEPAAYTP